MSPQAKTMIKALLVIDTKNRLSAMDALRHPWMRTERAILRRHSLHSSQKSIGAYFVRKRFQSAVKKVSVLSTHQSILYRRVIASSNVQYCNSKVMALNIMRTSVQDGCASKDYMHNDGAPVLNSVFSERSYSTYGKRSTA